MKVVRSSALHTNCLYPPRQDSLYSFMLEAESTPGPQCTQKDYVNVKFQLHQGNEPATFQLVARCLNQLHHHMPQELVSTVNIYPRLDIRALIISIQANKFTQYMYMFQASVAHHQRALQVVQNDRLVRWCLVCRNAGNSSIQNIYWIEYAVSWSSLLLCIFYLIYILPSRVFSSSTYKTPA